MPKTSLRIGLTGNIGSGKSTVARQFERLGVPVYYADLRAKALMVEDESLVNHITALFGPEAYSGFQSSNKLASPAGSAPTDQSRELNRAYLAERVFNRPEELAKLNAIVHPAVAQDALRWHRSFPKAAYTLYEAAISFETGGYKEMDAMVVVTASPELRLQRVTERDGSSASEVEARMERQWPEDKKVAAADYLIFNDGEQLLLPQVLKIDRALKGRMKGRMNE
jgi:dephospho-CoA kinase